ncbi:unnamed protein product [Blepharisma stoltei]|uniref:Receptor ligand binding region domain-containing protein n=1 Tax=Blepharisma stoltei TaxID=1481888 RepID=A0AAU9J7J9_9CILI|nr:unnamed protein product [Blepharisma stoltei]
MIILLSLFLWLSTSQFVTIPILYSQYTPWWIVDYIKANLVCSTGAEAGCSLDSPFQYVAIEINDFSDFENIFENSDYIFVYDGTTSLSISTFINYYARTYGFIQFINGNAPENPSEYVYYSDYSYSIYRKAALSIAKKYNIQKAVAIITSDFTGMDFTNDEGVEIVAQYVIIHSASYEYVVSLLTKEIKPLGVKWIFFETSTHVAQMFQQALVEADMYKEGYTYIFMQEASWGAYLEGAITLEARWYHSTGILDFINNIIYWTSVGIYEMITTNGIQGSYSPYTLDQFIGQLFTYESQGFTIWNVQSGNLISVGKINGDGINIYSPVMFPGGTYNVPNNDVVQIAFSINGASSTDDGRNAINQLGATYTIDMIKTKKLMLENFDIVVHNISDCGSSNFIYNSSHECFENHILEFGYFHISALETSMALGVIELFEALNLSTPVIGVETSTTMNDLKYYPQYIRVSYPNSHTASAAALILSIYGISKCSLLYSDSIWGRDFKSQFINQAKSYNIKILNQNMAVPLGFNSSNSNIIEEVIKAKSRYIVLEIYQPDILYVIEALYDLGMRKGDIYLIVGDGMISLSDLDEQRIGSNSYKKRAEIMNNLIYISFPAFQNQAGLAIENEFLSLYGFAYDYMCLFYDAAYLGIYAIDYLLHEGVNVNSSTIVKIIRDIKFTGCSGIVRISQDDSDRLTTNLGIHNLIEINSTWTINTCGLYDPSQLIVLQMTKTISWVTDGEVPNDIIGDGQECPFRSIDIQSFFYGYILLIIIEVIPFILGIGVLIRFYYYIFESRLQKLTSPEKENLYDILSYLLMLIESLQYMQIGPDFTNFFPKWSNVTKLSSLEIRGWIKEDKFTFWNQVELFEALSFLWIILLLLRKVRIVRKSKSFIIMTINEFNLYFLPLIGDALFLPICSFLFQTYQCTSSVGDNFKDSFNDHACSTFCWQGKHISYVITSSIAICLYMPTSLYFRSTWKESHPFHFQETVFHCVLKSFVQMALISLYTIVRPASEDTFLGLGIALISVYIAISIFKRPFNYDRASLWYIIFLICSLLIWVSCALAKFDKVLALVLLGVGWTAIIVAGLIYQKLYLPSLLQSEKAQNIHKLFRFQLFSMSPEDAGISKSVRYLHAQSSVNDEETNNRTRFNFIVNNFQSEDNMQSSKNLIDSSNLNLEVFNSSCSKDS